MKIFSQRPHIGLFMAFIVAAILSPTPANAENVHMLFPTASTSQHQYFYELLETSLKEAGHTPYISKVDNIPHLREWDMLKHGDISITWLVQNKERDKSYLPVRVPLTNGLIGKRILLIPEGKNSLYAHVQNLDDFKKLNLVGGFGTNWFDTGVWDVNGLAYTEIANPNLIYMMVATEGRDIDYFSRGFNEVVEEQRTHPILKIESHLMFQYNRDFIFYLSPSRPDLVPILTEALTKARDSGLIDRLVRKHWAENFEIIKPEERTIIPLAAP